VSLALHALLLTPLLVGTAQHRSRAQEAPGGSLPSRNDSVLTVVFFDERDSQPRAPPRLSDTMVLAPVSPVTLRALPAPSSEFAIPDAASSGERSGSPQAQGDATAFALLYGRYLGQITARIERAWMRPRTSPGTAIFACRLQVLQDDRGQVLEVTLGRCNAAARWRASLVAAVRSASPLPAPPDRHVFRRSITLALASEAFVPGGSTQGFEPVTLPAVRASAAEPPAPAAPDYLDQLRALREGRPGSVDLRIEGRPGSEPTTSH
jgi:TonB C terminal